MSYRLDLTAPVPDTLRATAVERLERAAERLREDHGGDPVGAVHGARKDLKKARALLRLARPGMPAKDYRKENRRLRDLGRELSGGRDADVMLVALLQNTQRRSEAALQHKPDAIADGLADRPGASGVDAGGGRNRAAHQVGAGAAHALRTCDARTP